MRIATWNIDRLHGKADGIRKAIEAVDADIIVLTEADTRLELEYPYFCFSADLHELDPDLYLPSERRIAIYSRKPVTEAVKVYNPYEALCIETYCDGVPVAVYGTVMGAFGNRNKSFISDVISQMEDIKKMKSAGKKICVCGDFNLSFSDNYYFTESGRNNVLDTFKDCGIEPITAFKSECIDHIALSGEITVDRNVTVSEWNTNKKLSDHKGIYADIT